jgi:hypothetical protein
MSILTIEPNSQADSQLFIGLAKRLNAKFSVSDRQSQVSKTKAKSKLSSFFGVLEDVDSEEMIKNIEESRTNKDIDISWVK